MQLTNAKAADALDAVATILKERIAMPVKPGYRIQKIADKLAVELKSFHQKRDELIQKHQELDAEGKPVSAGAGRVKLRQDTLQEFTDAMNALVEETITIEDITIPLSMLDGVSLAQPIISGLSPFLTEE